MARRSPSMPRNHVTIWFQLGMVGDASSVAAHTGCSNGKGQAATAVLSSAWLGGKTLIFVLSKTATSGGTRTA